jgi:hypothetical protein
VIAISSLLYDAGDLYKDLEQNVVNLLIFWVVDQMKVMGCINDWYFGFWNSNERGDSHHRVAFYLSA